jgi:hypothetical protein
VISVTAMNRSTNPLQQACMRPGDDETRVCDGSTGETRPALIADPLAPPLAVVPTRVAPAPRRQAESLSRRPDGLIPRSGEPRCQPIFLRMTLSR